MTFQTSNGALIEYCTTCGDWLPIQAFPGGEGAVCRQCAAIEDGKIILPPRR